RITIGPYRSIVLSLIPRCWRSQSWNWVTRRSSTGTALGTGDAWLLIWEDGLAAPLAREGDPEPIHIEGTDANFTIEWKGSYRIQCAAFIYRDRKRGGMRAIRGYPTHKLAAAARSS